MCVCVCARARACMCVRACGVCVCDPVEGRAAALVAGADDGAPGDEGEGEVRPPRLGHQVQRPLPVLVRLPWLAISLAIRAGPAPLGGSICDRGGGN